MVAPTIAQKSVSNFSPIQKNNHNWRKLAKLWVQMVQWECSEHIDNNTDEFDNWGSLYTFSTN